MNKILIVEDDRNIALGIEDNLKMEGFSPVLAHDGQEALEKIKTEKPDLIILDVMLPKLRGLEVCRKLKSDVATAAIRVLMITGFDDRENRLAGIRAGADDFLAKPFSAEDLLAKVQSLLNIEPKSYVMPSYGENQSAGPTPGKTSPEQVA